MHSHLLQEMTKTEKSLCYRTPQTCNDLCKLKILRWLRNAYTMRSSTSETQTTPKKNWGKTVIVLVTISLAKSFFERERKSTCWTHFCKGLVFARHYWDLEENTQFKGELTPQHNKRLLTASLITEYVSRPIDIRNCTKSIVEKICGKSFLQKLFTDICSDETEM